MENGSFEVVSKICIGKRFSRNEAFHGMQGNVLNGTTIKPLNNKHKKIQFKVLDEPFGFKPFHKLHRTISYPTALVGQSFSSKYYVILH